MHFTVLNWNIAGAKFLETKTREERDKIRKRLNRALRDLINHQDPKPDVVTLQEIVAYREPKEDKQELIDPVPGYVYIPFILIDSKLYSTKAKWNKVRRGSDWPSETYFAQGNAFLFREGAPQFPVWALPDLNQTNPGQPRKHCIEQVRLESGLYFGDRNTEPRAALVSHIVIDPGEWNGSRRPLDVFVVNLHLTTLMMEREGIPEIDSEGTRIRIRQLETVLNGIVSRYNSWRQHGYPERRENRTPSQGEDFGRHPPVWILAGDFNFTMESEEYGYIIKRNFVDVVPEKGTGSKTSGVGREATLNLDYVFAGPKFISLDPLIEEKGIKNNHIDHSVKVSDHYPLIAKIPLDLGLA